MNRSSFQGRALFFLSHALLREAEREHQDIAAEASAYRALVDRAQPARDWRAQRPTHLPARANCVRDV